jgi:hypothetical protein
LGDTPNPGRETLHPFLVRALWAHGHKVLLTTRVYDATITEVMSLTNYRDTVSCFLLCLKAEVSTIGDLGENEESLYPGG